MKILRLSPVFIPEHSPFIPENLPDILLWSGCGFSGHIGGHEKDFSVFTGMLLLLAGFPVFSDSGFSEKTFDEAVLQIMAKYAFPVDNIFHLEGYGFADLAAKKPVGPDSVFRMASMTKSFTALGLLILEKEGRLDLRIPVFRILPEVEIANRWENTDPVRIIHLLEHTAGFNEMHFNDYNLHDDPSISLERAMEIGRNSRETRWPPGRTNGAVHEVSHRAGAR